MALLHIDPTTSFDAMDEGELSALLLKWASTDERQTMSDSEIQTYMNTVIPRALFFKNLPMNARVLDLGAGDGGLSVYKEWPIPARKDVKMYALSLEWTERFEKYEAVELGDFEKMDPDFGGVRFDGVVCAHFIEHMTSIDHTLDYLDRRIAPGGRMYFEWPHAASKRLPKRQSFIDVGLPTFTTNFFDDQTHVDTWQMSDVAAGLAERGFQIESAGRTYMPYLADALKSIARRNNDIVCGTFAIWLKTGFAQYLVATKV
ncbi:MAG: methyltransferase domain-containing protein [Mesorhizobium sp.]|nr:methyltransferase domain-containing protein [Mesorhizobium sp.]